MANAAIFIGWGAAIRGREQQALTVFQEGIADGTRLQRTGEVENFAAVAGEAPERGSHPKAPGGVTSTGARPAVRAQALRFGPARGLGDRPLVRLQMTSIDEAPRRNRAPRTLER